MNVYSHTQRAGRWLWIPAHAGLVLLPVAVATRVWWLLAALPVLATLAWLFRSLTIEVTDAELRWQFGPGLIRRRLPLPAIAAAYPVTTAWYDGWGIHFTRYGWLHNVGGFHAVALCLKDGRRVALGTDEPGLLLAALRPALTGSPHAN